MEYVYFKLPSGVYIYSKVLNLKALAFLVNNYENRTSLNDGEVLVSYVYLSKLYLPHLN